MQQWEMLTAQHVHNRIRCFVGTCIEQSEQCYKKTFTDELHDERFS